MSRSRRLTHTSPLLPSYIPLLPLSHPTSSSHHSTSAFPPFRNFFHICFPFSLFPPTIPLTSFTHSFPLISSTYWPPRTSATYPHPLIFYDLLYFSYPHFPLLTLLHLPLYPLTSPTSSPLISPTSLPLISYSFPSLIFLTSTSHVSCELWYRISPHFPFLGKRQTEKIAKSSMRF